MYTKDFLIFAVEDDIPYGKLIEYCLLKQGYKKIRIFSNEKECLSQMYLKPRVLITDYRLKSMSGIDLVRKARKTGPEFYCILLTAMCQDEIINSVRSLQIIDKYIHKDLNSMSELLNTLDLIAYDLHTEQYA